LRLFRQAAAFHRGAGGHDTVSIDSTFTPARSSAMDARG
jgi:hypothetical protein